MKTPKREYYFYDSGINPDNGDIIRDAVMPELYNTRWKRKNRVRILKNTIAMLRRRLKDTEATLRLTQKITKCFIGSVVNELNQYLDEEDIDENLTESYPAVEFYSQRADDILSSMMDNADEKTIDETISSFRRAARKLGLRRYDDLIVFVDTEMMYDPAMIDQIVSTRAVEAHSIKGVEFCSQLVNGNLWLYFKSEEDGEKYMTIADLFNGNI